MASETFQMGEVEDPLLAIFSIPTQQGEDHLKVQATPQNCQCHRLHLNPFLSPHGPWQAGCFD
jgi:hypothetical protein